MNSNWSNLFVAMLTVIASVAGEGMFPGLGKVVAAFVAGFGAGLALMGDSVGWGAMIGAMIGIFVTSPYSNMILQWIRAHI